MERELNTNPSLASLAGGGAAIGCLALSRNDSRFFRWVVNVL